MEQARDSALILVRHLRWILEAEAGGRLALHAANPDVIY